MPSGSNYSHIDHLPYLINEVYRPRIEEDVNFLQLLPNMPFMFEKNASIYKLEQNGYKKEAAGIFFDHLKKVDEKGKYQIFMEALREANYPVLVNALENKEPIVNNEDELKQLISIFFNEIIQTVDPILLSLELQMKNVITSQEGDEIRNTATNSGKTPANLMLLVTMPRHSKDWYEIFLGFLLDHGHHKLLKKIDPKFFDQKMGSSEGEPYSIIENTDLSVSVPVDLSKQNKITNFTTSNVKKPNEDSHFKTPAVNAHSKYSPAVETKIGLDLARPVNNAATSVSYHPPSDQRNADSFSEFKMAMLRELGDFKSLFQEQTQYLKDLLQQTEQVVRRVDRLEEKLDIVIRSTSLSNNK